MFGPLSTFNGFMPDADATMPGVISECSALIPTLRGMAGAPSQVAPTGVGALAADCRGAAVTMNTAGSRRVFAGTSTKLYELVSATWTDVSRGSAYTGGLDSRWSVAQLGNATVASNYADTIQGSTSGAFADIAGAPKAKIVISSANFVIAFATVDGTYGDQADRWWCSAFQTHSDWTPSVTTQATTGRLIGGGGPVTAAAMLGQQAVAYKARNIFLGTYVGAPVVWQWDQVPGEVGCVGPEAVADIGGAHFFVGEDNIWLFDGTRPRSIADGQVRQWFFANSSATFRYKTIVMPDRQSGMVWVYFCGASNLSGTPDMALVYHLQKGIWGRADNSTQAALIYTSAGVTFDSNSGTFDAQPDVSFDSQYWLAGGRAPAVFNLSRQLVTLTGAATASSFTTGDFGDDQGVSFMRRARVRFLREPTAATAQGYIKSGEGRGLTDGGAATMSDSGFDVRQAGRWHRIKFNFTGPVEFTGMSVDTEAAGER